MFPSRDRGWKALRNDMATFCRILQFEPTHAQMHFLLRVQNINNGALRLGLPPMGTDDAFGIVATAMFYRAFVWEIPSYLFYENEANAKKWVQSMTLWGSRSIDTMRSQLQVSKQRRFLTANGIHVCHCIGPWIKDDKFVTGRQDIVLSDFDETPTFRIARACALTKGSMLYIPHNGTLQNKILDKGQEDRRQ